VLTDAQKHRFEENLELDFSFGVKGLSRFRANLFNQRGAVGAVFRAIPYEIKAFEDLGLPAVVKELCNKPRGLILVTGPTGSGKSTTLAAMIDKINRERHEHILTIEDPIEFLHNHKGCLINQREVNADTHGLQRRCAPPFVRTLTSCSSAKCATSKRSSLRCVSPRRAT
jgi:twitching motility protein PilT